MSDFETKATLLILIALCSIYIYLLVSPNQPHLPAHPINVVIQRDSLENFNKFMQEYKEYHYAYENYNYTDDKLENYNYTGSEWGSSGMHDDFFLDTEDPRESIEDFEPIVPSKNVLCEDVYITLRSELNYKYLWVLGVEKHRMAATATMDTPLHHRSFHVIPVDPSCSNGGWVLLKETDSDKFIKLISPNRTTLDNNDAWVITLGSNDSSNAFSDNAYHFLIENEGYILNKDVMGFITIFPTDSDYPARGHSSNYFRRDKPAGREFGSSMRFQTINQSYIEASLTKEKEEILQAQREDEILLEKIHSFPSSREKRVISFGIYGSNPKYISGALKNLELSKIYYEGWKCRFYVTSDVPEDILEKLRSGGAEIENIPSGMGYTSGMFWRFMIASDPSVDRYIIRDSDSRLNARER
ncbi:MAG: hypothetical protein M1365_06985 [Actinobacteria bacterium]|nr:hypothetical protein [Actinomycetota bacterium]